MALLGFLQGQGPQGNTENRQTSFGFEGSPFAGGKPFTAGMFPQKETRSLGTRFFHKQMKTSESLSSATVATAKNTEMSVDALEKQLNVQDNLKNLTDKEWKLAEKSFKADLSINQFFKKNELNRTRRDIRFHRELQKQSAEHQKINITFWKRLLHSMGIITHKKSWPLKIGSAIIGSLGSVLGGLMGGATGLWSMMMLRRTIGRAGRMAAGGKSALVTAGAGKGGAAAAGRAGKSAMEESMGSIVEAEAAAGRAGKSAMEESMGSIVEAEAAHAVKGQRGIISRAFQKITTKLKFPIAAMDPDMIERFLPKRGFGLRSMGRVGAGLAKGAGKFLPYAGAGVGLGMAAHSLSERKFADAFIHSTSGMASLIPGLGTVVSIALDVIGSLIPDEIKSKFDEFIGGLIDPLIKKVSGTLKNILGPTGFGILTSIWDRFSGIFANIGGILKDLFGIFTKLFVGPHSLPIIFGVVTAAISPFVLIASEFLKALKAFTGFINDFLTDWGEKGFWNSLLDSFKNNIWTWWSELAIQIGNSISWIFQFVGNFITKAIIGIAEFTIRTLVKSILPGFAQKPALKLVDSMFSGIKGYLPATYKEEKEAPLQKRNENRNVTLARSFEGNQQKQKSVLLKAGVSKNDVSIFQTMDNREKAFGFLNTKLLAPAKEPSTAQNSMQGGKELVKKGVNTVKESAGNLGTDIRDAAAKYGVNTGFLQKMAQVESSGNPNKVSPTGATGIFQFTKGTGQEYGLIGPGFDKRKDQRANVMAGAALAVSNAKELAARGIEATPGLLYLAHQQGVEGIAQILEAARTGGEVSASVRKHMNLNDGKGLSAREFLAKWAGKFEGTGSALVEESTTVGGTGLGAAGNTMTYLKNTVGLRSKEALKKLIDLAKTGYQNVAGFAGPAVTDLGQGAAAGILPPVMGGLSGFLETAKGLAPATLTKMNPEMQALLGEVTRGAAGVAQGQAQLAADIFGSEAVQSDPVLAKMAGMTEQANRYLQTMANKAQKTGRDVSSFVQDQMLFLFGNDGFGGDF